MFTTRTSDLRRTYAEPAHPTDAACLSTSTAIKASPNRALNSLQWQCGRHSRTCPEALQCGAMLHIVLNVRQQRTTLDRGFDWLFFLAPAAAPILARSRACATCWRTFVRTAPWETTWPRVGRACLHFDCCVPVHTRALSWQGSSARRAAPPQTSADLRKGDVLGHRAEACRPPDCRSLAWKTSVIRRTLHDASRLAHRARRQARITERVSIYKTEQVGATYRSRLFIRGCETGSELGCWSVNAAFQRGAYSRPLAQGNNAFGLQSERPSLRLA